MKTKISVKIIDLLKRDFSYADFAFNKLLSDMKLYERKYSMTWKEFVDRFESGKWPFRDGPQLCCLGSPN